MQPHIEPATALSQVRFLFRHSAPLVRLVDHPTSGDVAEIWSEIAAGAEAPIAVCVVPAKESPTWPNFRIAR